jgi:hypothetical protein
MAYITKMKFPCHGQDVPKKNNDLWSTTEDYGRIIIMTAKGLFRNGKKDSDQDVRNILEMISWNDTEVEKTKPEYGLSQVSYNCLINHTVGFVLKHIKYVYKYYLETTLGLLYIIHLTMNCFKGKTFKQDWYMN